MNPSSVPTSQLVLVRPEPPGLYTAQAVGLPEISATAATREEAIEQVRKIIQEWLAAGHLVAVQVPQENPLQKWFGHTNPNDPDERAYLDELARFRQEDLEGRLDKEFLEDLKRFREEDLQRTLQEYELEDRACSDSSSTPT